MRETLVRLEETCHERAETDLIDIVGNNVPVFFIQDAIQFPDLIHSGTCKTRSRPICRVCILTRGTVKPSPDSEIPQAASAHDSAWDFFSQQTTTLHTLFWAMSGYGIPRSYRHMVSTSRPMSY